MCLIKVNKITYNSQTKSTKKSRAYINPNFIAHAYYYDDLDYYVICFCNTDFICVSKEDFELVLKHIKIIE